MKERILHWRCNRAIEKMFTQPEGGLSTSLRRHMKACPDCRALYSRLARADRALGEVSGAGAAEIAPMEVELGWRDLSAQLAPAAAPEGKRPLLGLAVATALASVVILSVTLRGPAEEPAFLARGQSTPTLALFCIGPEPSPEPRPARNGDVASCRIDETLGFAFTNPKGAYAGLSLFGVSAENEVLHYVPDAAAPTGMAIEPADRQKPVNRTVRLGVNHVVGVYRIVAVFTPKPLALEALEAAAPAVLRGDNPFPQGHLVIQTLRMEAAL